jgi:hypothetical protein
MGKKSAEKSECVDEVDDTYAKFLDMGFWLGVCGEMGTGMFEIVLKSLP